MTTIPVALRGQLRARREEMVARAREGGIRLPSLEALGAAGLERVFACSDFVAQSCIQQPALLTDLFLSGDLLGGYGESAYVARVENALGAATDEPSLMAALRALRRREMVRIAWRDISGTAPLEETLRDLSDFADAAIGRSLARLHEWQARDFGTPVTATGDTLAMSVIALGKLGARELNFSSDVDLMFVTSGSGHTRGGRKEISSEEYFIRLGQRLIRALSEPTTDGFVFRVDMRLRPFGDSGPLAMTVDGVEAYYQTHGRDWERYALIKARAAAGDLAVGEELLAQLQPFVFRRYLDFGAIQALRHMKSLVAREVSRKGIEEDVKLGPGGIREVEFIVQSFQLIRGGRERALRDNRCLPVLANLADRGYLPPHVVDELRAAYRFLRNTEHRLQEAEDRQTQTLPVDDASRERLAFGLGFPRWDDFQSALSGHRARVSAHFEQVFAANEASEGDPVQRSLMAAWQGLDRATASAAELASAGFEDAPAVVGLLAGLRDSYSVRIMSRQGRERLDRLMPLLLGAVGQMSDRTETLRRLVPLLEGVARRSVYLALLAEHPLALSQLVHLCAASPWIAAELTRHPILLDELLDPRALYRPPDRAGLEAELEFELANVPAGDTEQEMDALRAYKHTNVLRVAAADVAHRIPVMVVSDHLTWIAEVLLLCVYRLAWRDVTARHGVPGCRVGERLETAQFAVLAYGKLGGIELGYSSDLDLVFLHSSRGEAQYTDGPRSVDNAVFFARLAQRMVHMITARTAGGVLYELDFRLRPSGSAGFMVSGIDAFETYHADAAWTWEHQALVRARMVVGDGPIRERFEAIRLESLTRLRDGGTLRAEVREMRERMRAELGSREKGKFDLKQDPGGIADIEFMVQYCTLLWGRKHPEILRNTDNIRLLEALAKTGGIPADDAQALMDAYRGYRACVHRLALQERSSVVPGEQFAAERLRVSEIWDRLLSG